MLDEELKGLSRKEVREMFDAGLREWMDSNGEPDEVTLFHASKVRFALKLEADESPEQAAATTLFCLAAILSTIRGIEGVMDEAQKPAVRAIVQQLMATGGCLRFGLGKEERGEEVEEG